MDILVICCDGVERAMTFQRHATAAGHRVHRIAPGGRMPAVGDAWLGVVCFDPSDQGPVRDDVRYLSAAVIECGSNRADTSDEQLLEQLSARCRAVPVSADVRGQVAEPLIMAVRQTLVEMTGVGVAVRSVYQLAMPAALGDVCAEIAIRASFDGSLIMSFSASTAAALARRVFADVKQALQPEMIQDCVGEITNVVAGQAKALLAGTPYHFVFSPPKIATPDAIRPSKDSESLVIAFDSDVGNLALQLLQYRSPRK